MNKIKYYSLNSTAQRVSSPVAFSGMNRINLMNGDHLQGLFLTENKISCNEACLKGESGLLRHLQA